VPGELELVAVFDFFYCLVLVPFFVCFFPAENVFFFFLFWIVLGFQWFFYVFLILILVPSFPVQLFFLTVIQQQNVISFIEF